MLLRVWALVACVALASPVPAHTQAAPTDDSLASGGTIPGDLLRRLPIDDPWHALTLIPGVVLRGGEVGIAAASILSVRGGAPTIYVDGAPARFQTLGVLGIGIAPNAIAHLAVTTGVQPAFVSDAGSGVISYLTRSGGDRLEGHTRFDSDEPFGDRSSVGYNRIEAALGGPLSGSGRLRFHLSGTLQGQRSSYRGLGAERQPTYLPSGVDTVVNFTDGSGNTFSVPVPLLAQWSGACAPGSNDGFGCQGLRRPLDWSTARRVQGKVDYSYGSESGLSFTLLASDLQQRLFPGQAAMDPALYAGQRARSMLALVNWRQALGAWRGGPLTLRANLSLGSERLVAGLLEQESELETRDPALGIVFESLRFTGVDGFPLPVTDRLVRNVRTNTGLRTPFLNRDDLRNSQPYRLNPYGMAAGWPSEGLDGQLTFVNERRLQARWALDWRASGAHRLTLGVDAERTALSLYTSSLLRQAFMDVFVEQPSRRGVFAGDRITLGAAVLDVGVRYDRFAPGGEFPKTPGRIYTHPAWSTNAASSDTAYANSVARVFTPATSKTALSPRVRFGYALSPHLSVRVGYGRWVQPPPYHLYFARQNSDLDFANVFAFFGRDVDFATASVFDLGGRLEAGGVGVDLSVYRKGLPLYGVRLQPFGDPFNPGDTIDMLVVTPLDDGHTLGLDARLDWRAGSWLTTAVAYSVVRSNAEVKVTTHAVGAVIALRLPGNWQDGTAVGSLARDLGALLTVRATSGLPYTRLINQGAGTVVPRDGFGVIGAIAEPPNASRLPWTKRIDLRLTKTVQAAGRGWTIYADLRNVLNFRNTLALFSETGDVSNDQHRFEILATEYGALANEAALNGALEPDGTVNLSACGSWTNPVNCVALTRVERRFGDGNGLYTSAEQDRVLNAYYDDFFGPWRFYGSGRTIRLGVEVGL